MRLYHGSTIAIPRPDVAHSRRNLDFGRGFYATSHKAQAERWAQRKAMLASARPIVSMYELSDITADARVLMFSENDEGWVKFVCACRQGHDPSPEYDLIVGGVADDKVYEAVNMYLKGLWDMATTLNALRFYGRSDQYCFTTQTSIDRFVSYVGSYEVSDGRD